MGILNYTTTVSAVRSIGEITSMLARKGAQRITQEFGEGGKTVALGFTLQVGDWPVFFALPANVEATLKVMLKDKPFTSRSRGGRVKYEQTMREQAERVSWRILKDWCEAQLALIECGQAEMAQVFLPYAQDNRGVTMWQQFQVSHQKQLGAGDPE